MAIIDIRIVKEILRGKSLNRTLVNLWLSGVSVDGKGMDLGSKDGSASYFRFLRIQGEIEFVDLNPKQGGVSSLDLEDRFPIATNSQDYLLLFNVLEHLFGYENCIQESFRILKPGGRLVGSVPFLYPIHLDPDDFFRFTKSSLIRIFETAGFSIVHVEPVGRGPGVAATQQIFGLMPRPFRMIVTLVAITADSILGFLTRKNWSGVYPLAFVFEVEKPDDSREGVAG